LVERGGGQLQHHRDSDERCGRDHDFIGDCDHGQRADSADVFRRGRSSEHTTDDLRRQSNDNTEPFGDSVPNDDPGSTGSHFNFPPRFLGTYADAETGLLYNWHRTLDPTRDQYLQAEPFGLAGDINLYRYARDNSLSFIDPDGQASISIPGRSASVGISAAIPVSRQIPIAIGGGTGITLRQCCNGRGKIMNELLWTVRFGVGAGLSVAPSASGRGVVPVAQVGGLPRCAPSVDTTFLGSVDITAGPVSGRVNLDSKILNVGASPGSMGGSVVLNLFERTVVIDQKETGDCCTPK
jgi:RHS repeat-associated protein